MKITSFYLLALTLVALTFASLFIGKFGISFAEYMAYFKALLGFGDIEAVQNIGIIIDDIRLPRILSCIIIGAALSVSGGAYQNMFVNPLVSPSILGVLGGASFGAALSMMLNLNSFFMGVLTFLFGLLAVCISVFIAMFSGIKNILLLVLGGIISSSFFGSLLAILKYIADPNDTLPAITYFLMGSLSFADKNAVFAVAIPMVVGIVLLIFLGKYLDALSLDEDEAKSLGINTTTLKFTIIIVATIISALSVTLAGIIGWIGLIIPHISRFLFGAVSKNMLIGSAFLGSIFLLICDIISRMAFTYELPIGIVTSFFGIPIFVIVLYKVKAKL